MNRSQRKSRIPSSCLHWKDPGCHRADIPSPWPTSPVMPLFRVETVGVPVGILGLAPRSLHGSLSPHKRALGVGHRASSVTHWKP